jgi:hypothetical protein
MARYLDASVSVAAALALSATGTPTAESTHSWEDYHWGRKTNLFTPQPSNNLNGTWCPLLLAAASNDWASKPASSSDLLASMVVSSKAGKNRRPPVGGDENCNAKHGSTGWLGQIALWLTDDHRITQATVKVNDS